MMNIKKFNRTEYKGILIGMILGDGGVYDGNRKNAFFQMHHSLKQKEYADKKAEILKRLTEVNILEDTFGIRYRTRRHPIYTELRKRFYYDGRKTVESHLMKLLSLEGLAYWYFDDGCMVDGVLKQRIMIATNNFNLAEHELMAYWLSKKFNLHFEPKKKGNYWCLKINKKDTEKMVEMIRPYVSECMKYKLDYKKIHNNARELICKGCNNSFLGENRDRIFCSKSCQAKFQNNFHLQNRTREIVKI